jgi:hypothetical protein
MEQKFKVGKDANGGFKMPPNGAMLKRNEARGDNPWADPIPCNEEGRVCGTFFDPCGPGWGSNTCYELSTVFVCKRTNQGLECLPEQPVEKACGTWNATSGICESFKITSVDMIP